MTHPSNWHLQWKCNLQSGQVRPVYSNLQHILISTHSCRNVLRIKNVNQIIGPYFIIIIPLQKWSTRSQVIILLQCWILLTTHNPLKMIVHWYLSTETVRFHLTILVEAITDWINIQVHFLFICAHNLGYVVYKG